MNSAPIDVACLRRAYANLDSPSYRAALCDLISRKYEGREVQDTMDLDESEIDHDALHFNINLVSREELADFQAAWERKH